MKTNQTYEAPQLDVTVIGVELGFATSGSSAIENPTEVDDSNGYWS